MENYIWPGAYNFQGSLKLLLEILKREIETILKKIDELDKLTKK